MIKDMTNALRELMEGDRNTNVVPSLISRGSAPQAKSAVPLPGGSKGGSGGGPYTEAAYEAREFWPNAYTTTDGLFFLPAIKKVVMTDGAGGTVPFNYAEPPA